MATLFDKIKKALGFYPKASYYKIDTTTSEPVKVEYQQTAQPEVTQQPEAEEPAIDNKYDGVDLAADYHKKAAESAQGAAKKDHEAAAKHHTNMANYHEKMFHYHDNISQS